MHLFEVHGSDETGSQFSSHHSITKNLTNIIIVLNASVIVHHRCQASSSPDNTWNMHDFQGIIIM